MKKKTKYKIIAAVVMLFGGSAANIYFSGAVMALLTKVAQSPQLFGAKECIAMITRDPTFFLSIEACLLVALVFFLFYKRGLIDDGKSCIELTDTISTPAPAGNKQHGSATWLHKKDWDLDFTHYTLNSFSPLIKELIASKDDDNYILKTKDTKLLDKGGVVLGSVINVKTMLDKFYYESGDYHSIFIGATRSGKSRRVVLPTIGTLALAGESMVISDPKGELYNYTSTMLKKLGYNIKVLDFKNPLKSDRYNFLQPVIDAIDANDIAKAIESAWDLTVILVGESKGERIWTDGEVSIIAASIMCVICDNKEGAAREFQNMTNVFFFIAEMCKSIDDTMPLIAYVKNMPSDHPAKGLLAISEIAPEKTRGSFYTSAMTTLQLFSNPLIYSMSSESDYTIEELSTTKMALFIILPDSKSLYYKIAALLVSQHYEQLVHHADARGGRLQNRVNFILDEFGNFTKIIDFTNKLTVGGGRGIRFNLFVQSLTQITEKYGKETAVTIKGNCATWVYLKTDDNETLKELSEKLGYYTISTNSQSQSTNFKSDSASASSSLMKRALLMPDEIGKVDMPYSLLMTSHSPAVMTLGDIGGMLFNKIFGLGDEDHNRQLRERRENARPARVVGGEMKLWGIWFKYTGDIEREKEEKMRRRAEASKFKVKSENIT